jgi:membrane protease YdiL (CAAX protease family)
MAIARGPSALRVAVGAFVAINLLARLAVAGLEAVGLTPGPGTPVSVLTFQGLGVVVVIVAFLRVAGGLADWRSYLRLERFTMETVRYGSVVAFVSVVVLGVWTAVAGSRRSHVTFNGVQVLPSIVELLA